MKIGVVIHGPEAIDSGLAATAINHLRAYGEVKATVGGATGIVAVIDAGLENLIDISRREMVSDALVRMSKDSDLLVLINQAKNGDTAIEFGGQVFSKVEKKLAAPLFQIDKEQVIFWNPAAERIARDLALKIGKKVFDGTEHERRGFGEGFRKIWGVKAGEAIWINGRVIGRAEGDDAAIREDGKGGLQLIGIRAKDGALERVGKVDIKKAIIRSGVTRRTNAIKREVRGAGDGRAYLVDHDAESAAFSLRGASIVVTVGDDTTINAGSILSRFGIPIIGITDGDEDAICNDKSLARGSVIFRVRSGEDDIVGKRIRDEVFHGKAVIDIDCEAKALADRIQEAAKESILSRNDC